MVIEITGGYAVIDRSLRAEQGDMVLINHRSRNQFAKLLGKALIVFFGCLILQALGILEMSHRSLATLANVIVSMIGLLKAIVETTENKKR